MIRDTLRATIQNAAKTLFGEEHVPDFSLEIPERSEYGDYATNIALVLGKKLGQNPRDVAGRLEQEISGTWETSIAGPGFLNFKIAPETLAEEFYEILKKKHRFGAGTKTKKKIQIEFISANPTGPLTLANGRGGFLGDALAHVLTRAGSTVEREYYVNDAGNQVVTLGKSLLAAAGAIPEEESFYKGEYVKEWAGKHSIVTTFKDDPEALGKKAAADFLKQIQAVVEQKSGIVFDRYTLEDRDIRKKGLHEKVLCLFADKGFVYDKDGAKWLRTTDFGDDKDRVLVTSDGFPTYFLADCGHYLETKLRKFAAKINIVGPDHYGYVKRIGAAAEIIGLAESHVIVTQAIRLLRDGKEAKMSKRKGEFVTFEELIDEIGIDAARYFFLEKTPQTHIDIDLDLAKERSVKNPVYYVQYAYVRAQSILAKGRGIKINAKGGIGKLITPEEYALIKKLIQLPEIIEDTAEDFGVHRMVRYAHDLARSFHNFYEKERVITDDPLLTQARLELDRAVIIVLGIVLDILGISKPKKM